MIYVTGDTHGGSDIKKLVSRKVTDTLTKEDTLMICGDFGFIWDTKKEARKEKTWLDWFADMPWTTIFADGNHECFPRLFTYPEEVRYGGHVHVIRRNLYHAMRGEVFTIEGKKIFVMGGASSHDRGPAAGNTKAVIGKYWWPEELPSEEEFRNAENHLDACSRHVDLIITHCLPSSLQHELKHGTYPSDCLTKYLEKVMHTVSYEKWYCGHYHCDLDLENNISVLFKKVLPAGSTVINSDPIPGSAIYQRGDELLFLLDGHEEHGIIRAIYPWGMLKIKDEPCYDIEIADTGKTVKYVRESSIIRFIRKGKDS